MKLKYDEPLSKFAFNFDLRHYIKGGCKQRRCDKAKTPSDKVGRCTLKADQCCVEHAWLERLKLTHARERDASACIIRRHQVFAMPPV